MQQLLTGCNTTPMLVWVFLAGPKSRLRTYGGRAGAQGPPNDLPHRTGPARSVNSVESHFHVFVKGLTSPLGNFAYV